MRYRVDVMVSRPSGISQNSDHYTAEMLQDWLVAAVVHEIQSRCNGFKRKRNIAEF